MKLTQEQLLNIIKEELESVMDEKKGSKRQRKKKAKKKAAKKDACYRKVKSRYDVWPSAYASGALSKCRKVGAKNWGNKSEGLNEDFETHDMYDPKTGKAAKARKEQEHNNMAKKGYTHVDPKRIEKVLRDEGGASGLDPFLKEFGEDMKDEIIKTLNAMPNVGQHKNKDYILDDNAEVDVVKERKKNCGCGQTPCKTYGRADENINEEESLEEKNSKCTKVTKKASSTRKGKKWMKCVKSDSGGYKRIHWGQAGVRVTGKSGNTKRKKSFKKRHNCSKAKSNTPQGQACKDWAE